MTLQVGDVVVLFVAGAPCRHNSGEFPNHPCRGTVLKIGTKSVHVSSRGSPMRIPLDGTKGTVLPLPEAKVKYRESFDVPGQWRTKAFIDACVERL